MRVPEALKPVEDFWQVEACGTQFVHEYGDRAEFFAKFREHRYRTLWFIPRLVPFDAAAGKDLLEIGCGNGADGVMFASRGARYTGVDLTETAVNATREHFEILGLQGRFQTENAEHLSFPDASFDIVYSMGVLHHTANTRKAVEEVHRVLRPGGRAIVMLYHRNSFNYHVRILGYMRLRILMRILSRAGHWDADRKKLAATSMVAVRGNQTSRIWEAHYKNFLEQGWGYLAPSRLVHHCTDGPACPIAYTFSKADARKVFSMFREVDFAVAHMPVRQYVGNWFPASIEGMLATRMGWNLMIYAVK